MELKNETLKFRQQQVLYDQKWRKFLKRSWPFRFILFLDFALGAGSMATGNIKETSDFDVILGAKLGRIFTVRFFSVVIFSVFGLRKKKMSHHEAASDKICLNHFVTENSYRLSPPHNLYWQKLYTNLVPIFGSVSQINKFFDANRVWTGNPESYQDDLRHKYRQDSLVKKLGEFILSGGLGNRVENVLKNLQIKKIEQSLKNDPPGFKPRIKYGESELEFHPDTRRIEEYENREKTGRLSS